MHLYRIQPRVRTQTEYPAQAVQLYDPGYLDLARSGELQRRADQATAGLANCRLCPHACGVNRLAGETGVCRAGPTARVASWTVHPWEEPPISGTRGSGTIFFSWCTGRCIFCQNYPISQLGYGNEATPDRLAEMMLELQSRGCHNINLVTPTHFVPQFLQALVLAAQAGLKIPIVYNSSGYEQVATLRLLSGIVDLWLPDAKYASDAVARKLSGFPNYVAHNQAALREIYSQVGPQLQLAEDGTAVRGMIVRHLVLPDDLDAAAEVLTWLARDLSPAVNVSLMDQYFPAHRALEHAQLGRKITPTEYEAALQAFEDAGLTNGWLQEHDSGEGCAP
jgi:putative pyruvate formate lyase activating enzyme